MKPIQKLEVPVKFQDSYSKTKKSLLINFYWRSCHHYTGEKAMSNNVFAIFNQSTVSFEEAISSLTFKPLVEMLEHYSKEPNVALTESHLEALKTLLIRTHFPESALTYAYQDKILQDFRAVACELLFNNPKERVAEDLECLLDEAWEDQEFYNIEIEEEAEEELEKFNSLCAWNYTNLLLTKETDMSNQTQNTTPNTTVTANPETVMSDFAIKGRLSSETLSFLREDSVINSRVAQKTLKSFDAHPGLQGVLNKLPGTLNRLTVMYKEAGSVLRETRSLETIKGIDKEAPIAIALLGKGSELTINGVTLENTKLGMASSVVGLTLDSYVVPEDSQGAWIIVFWKHEDQDFQKAPGVSVKQFQPVSPVVVRKARGVRSEATQKYLESLKGGASDTAKEEPKGLETSTVREKVTHLMSLLERDSVYQRVGRRLAKDFLDKEVVTQEELDQLAKVFVQLSLGKVLTKKVLTQTFLETNYKGASLWDLKEYLGYCEKPQQTELKKLLEECEREAEGQGIQPVLKKESVMAAFDKLLGSKEVDPVEVSDDSAQSIPQETPAPVQAPSTPESSPSAPVGTQAPSRRVKFRNPRTGARIESRVTWVKFAHSTPVSSSPVAPSVSIESNTSSDDTQTSNSFVSGNTRKKGSGLASAILGFKRKK